MTRAWARESCIVKAETTPRQVTGSAFNGYLTSILGLLLVAEATEAQRFDVRAVEVAETRTCLLVSERLSRPALFCLRSALLLSHQQVNIMVVLHYPPRNWNWPSDPSAGMGILATQQRT